MKIVTQTPHRLELKSGHPLWAVLATLLFGLPFLAGGIWSLIFSRQLTELFCQRMESNQIKCQITYTGLLGSRTKQIYNLEKAEVKRHSGEDSDTYSVVLFADQQKFSYSSASTSNYSAKRAEARKINAFINNPQQFALSMRDDNRWVAYLVGSIFTIVGGAIIFICWWSKLIFHTVLDKNLRRLRIHQKSALGLVDKQSWHLKDIEAVSIEQKIDSDGDAIYRLFLQLKSGNQLSMSAFAFHNQLQAEAIAAKIREFLG